MVIFKGGVLGGAGIVRRPASARQCAPTSRLLRGVATAAALTLAACGTLDLEGSGTDTKRVVSTYLGSVSADDPQVADVGRRVLRGGGTAGDAAAAMGLALTVTLPSRASLDGGGVCLVHGVGASTVDEVDFLPPPPTGSSAPIPGLVRAMEEVQARYGVLRWQEAVGMAEKLAQTGIAVTPMLLADLVANGLDVSGPSGSSLQVGEVLPQRSVSATLSQLRIYGAADLYRGHLAAQLIATGLPAPALAEWLPTWRPAGAEPVGDQAFFVPGTSGGQMARAALHALAEHGPAGSAAFEQARAAAGVPSPELPAASSGFVVSDAQGRAVSCAVSIGKLFGGGLISGLDIYMGAPLGQAAAASLAPMIVLSGQQMTAAVAGSGSDAAPADAASVAWLSVLRDMRPAAAETERRSPEDATGKPVPDRVNAIVCREGSPRAAGQCIAERDPRGSGFAVTADRFSP